MRRIFLLLLVTISLVACTTSDKPIKVPIADSVCGMSTKGKTDASVTYRADSKFEISMKLNWEVGENTEFRIKLKPKKGSANAVVTTTGVSTTKPGGDINWMNKNGTAESLKDKTLILCVPEGDPVGTEYKFDINVAGIGTIDPRVAVTW